jgi:hypothetical protein
MADMVRSEDERTARLLEAQGMAAELFAAVEAGGLIAPGVGERQASDAIRDLAGDMFGTERWWHKRIVRAGPNTLNLPGEPAGLRCHWILEVHLVDVGRQIGGFHEELLDIGPDRPA